MGRVSNRPPPSRRADARRNEGLLLRIASEVFSEKGVNGSLEEIARRAEVGIGTLYRHFPSRVAIVEALFTNDVAALKSKAEDLCGSPDTRAAIRGWFIEFAMHVAAFRGLSALFAHGLCAGTGLSLACGAMLDSADSLVGKARREGIVRADVRTRDLIALVNALVWSAEQERGRERGKEAFHGSISRMLEIILSGAFTQAQPGPVTPAVRRRNRVQPPPGGD